MQRFAKTLEDGILYRPDIVEEMKGVLFEPENRPFGMMVRGPHGVGKSHSLVNLVHTLRSEGHIVTFVPDASHWSTTKYLVETICRSMSTTLEHLGLTAAVDTPEAIEDFAKVICEALTRRNENNPREVCWILVVDQLNRIFGRPGYENCKDVGVLPLPFSLMSNLNVNPHAQVVVSASANNSTFYKHNHEGFTAYDHPLIRSSNEIKIWKSECSERDAGWWHDMLESTGGCPLQVSVFLRSQSRSQYESDAADDVFLQTYKHGNCWTSRMSGIVRTSQSTRCIACFLFL
jgi:hypothetical protein